MFEGELNAAFGVLEKQRLAWNAGNVARFMEGYEKSENITFVGKGGVKRGYAKLLGDYAERYPTRDAMGTLAFRDVEMRQLADTVILAIGGFVVVPAGDAEPSTGWFSLVLRKGEHGWRNSHDHTS